MRNKPAMSAALKKINVQDGDIILFSGSRAKFLQLQDVAQHLKRQAIMLHVDTLESLEKASDEQKDIMRKVLEVGTSGGCCGNCKQDAV